MRVRVPNPNLERKCSVRRRRLPAFPPSAGPLGASSSSSDRASSSSSSSIRLPSASTWLGLGLALGLGLGLGSGFGFGFGSGFGFGFGLGFGLGLGLGLGIATLYSRCSMPKMCMLDRFITWASGQTWPLYASRLPSILITRSPISI